MLDVAQRTCPRRPVVLQRKKQKQKQKQKIGMHCVHVGSASTERFSGSVKTLHSCDRCASFSRKRNVLRLKKQHAKTVT